MIDEQSTTGLPCSRPEARRLGYKRYFTGKPCVNGHVDYRFTSNTACASCQNKHRQKWREDNAEKNHDQKKQWAQKNAERKNELSRGRYKTNIDRERALRREYYATRFAAKLQRTPAWADRDAIRLVYAEADRLTAETGGVEYHVDHFYPMQGETVSGLHVAENLEAIPAHVNLNKQNEHPDDFYGGMDDE